MLAIDKVRFVGEPIAVVVTEIAQQGEDAAEAVIVDYDVLEALVDLEAGDDLDRRSSTTAPAATSCSTSTALGMPDNTGDEFFADCEVDGHRPLRQPARRAVPARGSRLRRRLGRRPPAPVAQHAGRPGRQRRRSWPATASSADSVRVITPDVGGGFGAKITVLPGGDRCSALIAKQVGRPLRWRETRSESMMVLGHGRAQVQYVTIGGSRDGKVTHYRLHVIQDSGALRRAWARSSPRS